MRDPNARIADFGCGLGRMAGLLAEFRHRVTGIDNNMHQIEGARELHSERENISFVNADMEETGLDGDSMDIVLISQALHHSPEPQLVIDEAARVLAPGGKILILDLHHHNLDWLKDRFGDYWLGFEEEQLQEWIESAGFVNLCTRIIRSDEEYTDIDTLIVRAELPAGRLELPRP